MDLSYLLLPLQQTSFIDCTPNLIENLVSFTDMFMGDISTNITIVLVILITSQNVFGDKENARLNKCLA